MAVLLVGVGTANAAETRRDSFEDWGFICSKPDNGEDARESCNIFQTAVLNNNEQGEGGSQRVLLTRVGYMDGTELPVLLVTAPLGILLPMGIVVEVEGHEAIRLPVQRCDGNGCLAYVAMEEPFVDAMRKGSEAEVTFHDAQRRSVTIPLSLMGFTRAMQELSDTKTDS